MPAESQREGRQTWQIGWRSSHTGKVLMARRLLIAPSVVGVLTTSEDKDD